jgi:aspartate aminotransferase
MPVAKKIQQFMENSSWIREMFEAGNRLREEIGPENVFDFSLGNPDLEPPPEFKAIFKELAAEETPGVHRYMPNAGLPDVRAAVADYISTEFGLNFTGEDIVITVGAGGALNIALKTILD